jgi:tRNA pseudouridine55 synthase
MAAGVLPVLLGRATRLASYIQDGQKQYLATVHLGAATDTDDAEGSVVSESAVPPLSRQLVDDALAGFVGEILQKPPSYSALKIAGQRAYAVARRGEQVDLAPRLVTIRSVRLVDWSATELKLDVTCAKGTYIRALARDLAVALGTVGHLTALVRTAVGPFRLADSLTLDEIGARGMQDIVLPASAALPDALHVSLDSAAVTRLANGQALKTNGLRAEHVWVYDSDRVVCLARADGSLLHPRLIL